MDDKEILKTLRSGSRSGARILPEVPQVDPLSTYQNVDFDS